MKITNYIGLIYAILILACDWSCSNSRSEQDTGASAEFDIDVDETVLDLRKRGFSKLNEPFGVETSIVKKYDSMIVEYTFDPELGIYGKSIACLGVGADSSSIANFLDSKGVLIWSPIFSTKSGASRFFAKGKYSGLLFNALVKNGNVTLTFDFPNDKNFRRSRYRSVDMHGNVIVKSRDGSETYLIKNEFDIQDISKYK